MNPARDLFDRLATGEHEILAQLRSPDAENDYVDFKESDSKPEKLPTVLGESDKATLAEAISGFYNTAGGVIVWGIKCRDDENHGTRCCVPGLSEGSILHAALQRKVAEVVRPAVNGIEFKLVPLAGNGRMALLMYVPAREGGLPVEANIKQKRGYYFRAGTSFVTIPPDILAGMMGARPASLLRPFVTPTKETGALSLDVCVENVGRGMAFHMYVIVQWFRKRGPTTPVFELDEVEMFTQELRQTDMPRGTYVMGKPEFRLPPSGQRYIGTLHIPLEGRLQLRIVAGAEHDLPGSVEYDFSKGVVDRVAKRSKELSAADIWTRLLKHAGRASSR